MNVINFNDALENGNKNKKIIDDITKKYQELLATEEASDYYDGNLEFLINNYEKINEQFKSGIRSNKSLLLFIDRLNTIFKNVRSYETPIFLLVYYNLYRIYEDELFKLSNDDILLAINVCFEYAKDNSIAKSDDLIDSFFKYKDRIEKLVDIASKQEYEYSRTNDFMNNYLDAYDLYVSTSRNVSMRYYLDDIILERTEMEDTHEDEKLTFQSVYDNLYGWYCFCSSSVRKNIENSKIKNKLIDLNEIKSVEKELNSLDEKMSKFGMKLDTISHNEEYSEKTLDTIQLILSNKNDNMIEKLKKVLNLVDTVFNMVKEKGGMKK